MELSDNYLKVPIIINNRNRLTTTKKLVSQLAQLGYFEVHIIDNNSTYRPLLDWYEGEDKYFMCIHRLKENSGQLAGYNIGLIQQFKTDWVVYTDSDIELAEGCTKGFIERMITIAEQYNYDKVGLSLGITYVPLNKYTERLIGLEQQYWSKEIAPNIYEADVDTTFCIIKPSLPFEYKALRVGTMRAKHTPWYLDYDNLTEEEQYVLEHNNPQYSTIKGEILKHKNG